jgi:hypothetical protein
MNGRWFLLASVALSVFGACSRSAPATYPVTGSVTLDGKPVANGNIVFIPADRGLGPEGGRIVEGKFSARSKAGKCRVEITAENEVGPNTPRFEDKPIRTNYIPARYNFKSELTVDVAANPNNAFALQLTSR